MTKEKFIKIRNAAIVVIICIFCITTAIDYFKESKQRNNIKLYDLPQKENQLINAKENEENIEKNNESEINSASDNSGIQENTSEDDNNKDSGIININNATSEQLQKLYRIGPALAEKIIEYRDTYGYFETIEEIKEVSGIGDKTYEKIKEYITTH